MNKAKKQREKNSGKTRDLFKKIGEIKGTFYARVGTIKDRNGKDITEAERGEEEEKGMTEDEMVGWHH